MASSHRRQSCGRRRGAIRRLATVRKVALVDPERFLRWGRVGAAGADGADPEEIAAPLQPRIGLRRGAVPEGGELEMGGSPKPALKSGGLPPCVEGELGPVLGGV